MQVNVMKLILKLLIGIVAILVSAYIIPGVTVDTLTTAIVVAIVLGALNTFIAPILKLITLPLTCLTLGLFLLVINTLMVLLVVWIVPGFEVDGFLTAFLFSIAVSLIGGFLNAITD